MNKLDPIQVFRTEAAELFEQIEGGLLDLLNDPSDHDRVDAVFRGLHTLKGSGAMFGFDALAGFTHHCETAFDRVRRGEVPATAALISCVLEAQDHMKALVAHPHAGDDNTSQALLERLRAAVSGTPSDGSPVAIASSLLPANGELRTYRIDFQLAANALSNGTNPLGLLDELRELGDCTIAAELADLPPLPEFDPLALYIGWRVKLVTERPYSEIEDVFIFVRDDAKMKIEKIAPEALPNVATRDPAVIEASQSEFVAESKTSVSVNRAKAAENVRVPAERLDELMDRVGELVIAQSRLSQLANSSVDIHLRSVSEDVERLSGELRDTMMILRMVPVGSLFGRFRRLAHDLARETGKSIEINFEGESTEIDKTIIERLADPLVHLVRNACDHGLETPDQRLDAGKSRMGHVTLSAHQTGGEVVIKIRDDGRGIDRDRVRAKAESSGLVQPGQQLVDQDLLQLIFQPGFSTASEVTSLSGRGVGMDVVKKTIETLRGHIDIRSEPGTGSEISLRIPLTLAIIDGLLIRVGAGRYVIPLSAVEECLELSIEQDLRSRGRSFISLRDSLIPFLRLRDLFQTGTAPDPLQKVVVVSTGAERVGLVVDQIIGDHQTVIKSMSRLHNGVVTFSGATILGDGGVALILDVSHLVNFGQQQEEQMRAVG